MGWRAGQMLCRGCILCGVHRENHIPLGVTRPGLRLDDWWLCGLGRAVQPLWASTPSSVCKSGYSAWGLQVQPWLWVEPGKCVNWKRGREGSLGSQSVTQERFRPRAWHTGPAEQSLAWGGHRAFARQPGEPPAGLDAPTLTRAIMQLLPKMFKRKRCAPGAQCSVVR